MPATWMDLSFPGEGDLPLTIFGDDVELLLPAGDTLATPRWSCLLPLWLSYGLKLTDLAADGLVVMVSLTTRLGLRPDLP